MGTLQLKVRLRVIKFYIAPSMGAVAAFTTCFPIKSTVKRSSMNVLVALLAGTSHIPEIPPLILFMTGKAGGGKVSTAQFEIRRVVPLDRETGLIKSICGMTIGTVRILSLVHKLLGPGKP